MKQRAQAVTDISGGRNAGIRAPHIQKSQCNDFGLPEGVCNFSSVSIANEGRPPRSSSCCASAQDVWSTVCEGQWVRSRHLERRCLGYPSCRIILICILTFAIAQCHLGCVLMEEHSRSETIQRAFVLRQAPCLENTISFRL